MNNNKKGFLIMNECSHFCRIAVDMKFVTAEQLTESLAEQADDDLSNKPHGFIGKILLKIG